MVGPKSPINPGLLTSPCSSHYISFYLSILESTGFFLTPDTLLVRKLGLVRGWGWDGQEVPISGDFPGPQAFLYTEFEEIPS